MSTLLSGKPGEKALLMGNEALVRGAFEAGLDFASCYPGTPSSEVSTLLFGLQKKADFYMEFATNEKVATEAAAGAALAGLKSMTSLKHVGLNVAADPLGTLSYMGVRGAMVIYNADDPGMFSSQNEQDNRHFATLFNVPMFEPSSAQEMKDMTVAAFELSHELGMPVVVRATTRIAHMRGPVVLGPVTPAKKHARFERAPKELVSLPANARVMHVRLLERMEKAAEISEKSPFNVVEGEGTLGVITSSASVPYVLDAVRELGLTGKVAVYRLGMTNPLPEKGIARFLAGKSKVLVVEELEPWLENAVKAIAQAHGLNMPIRGKGTAGLLTRLSEYDPALVRSAMAEYFEVEDIFPDRADASDCPPLPVRPPSLCAGCPHRMTYFAAKKAAEGMDVIFPNDIGCYTLGFMPPLQTADTVLCMGASVSVPAGLGYAVRESGQKILAFIGDSTFFHSGMTGLVHAVFNNHKFTLVILDNQITAMTGHQPSPAMDPQAVDAGLTPVDIEAVVRGLGVKHVQVVRPTNLKKTEAAIREALEYDGLSVIIAREPCPLSVKRHLGKQKAVKFTVDQDKCSKCRACISTFACPAFFVENETIRIDPALCAGCAVCVQVCPAHAIKPAKAD